MPIKIGINGTWNKPGMHASNPERRILGPESSPPWITRQFPTRRPSARFATALE